MKKPQIILLCISVIVALMLFIPATSIANTIINKNEDYKDDVVAPCPVQLKLKDKYYLVVAMGYDSYKMNDKLHLSNIDEDRFFMLDPMLNLSGLVGEFILGYGKYFNQFYNTYLGLEFFVSGTAADNSYELNISDFPIVVDTDIIVNRTYGINLIPGIKFNNSTLAYVKLGYNWSMISIDETVRNNTWTSVEINDSHTSHGLSYGVGLESAVDEFFSIRAELTHMILSSFYSESGTKISPSNNQVLLGLVYHFT